MRSHACWLLVAIGCGGDIADPIAAARADDDRRDGIYGVWVREDDAAEELHLARNGRYLYEPGGERSEYDRGSFRIKADALIMDFDAAGYRISGDVFPFRLDWDDQGPLLLLTYLSDYLPPVTVRWRRPR